MADSELTPERRAALARKGGLLFSKQCAKADGVSCAEGFVEHQLELGHVEVVRDFLGYLRSRLRTLEPAGNADLGARTKDLIDRIEWLLAGHC
jgi:hypothetical protein